MGIGLTDLDLLIRLRRTGQLDNARSIIEIGAQQLSNHFFHPERLREVAALFNADPVGIAALGQPGSGPHGPQDLPPDAPLARKFWEWLGFRYAAIDIDGSPDSIPIDLNYDAVPNAARARYDLVTNFGTTEHVAYQLNAFKVIHDLTALNGVMIHNLPAQGNANHGLINYNVKFFWMLARSNSYHWLFMNYLDDGVGRGLREDIVNSVAEYCPDITTRAATVSMSDAGIVVALKKVRNIEYVAPLDVNAEAKAPNQIFKRRYWTIFGGKPPLTVRARRYWP